MLGMILQAAFAHVAYVMQQLISWRSAAEDQFMGGARGWPQGRGAKKQEHRGKPGALRFPYLFQKTCTCSKPVSMVNTSPLYSMSRAMVL